MQLGIWALGVVAAALEQGITRADEFGAALDIPPHLLMSSLDDLVDAGLMERTAAGDVPHYLLTDHGRDLHETVTALGLWHDRWLTVDAEAAPPPAVAQIIAEPPAHIELSVLGGFSISVDGHAVTGLPAGSQRLLIFLALHDRTVSRIALANAMWPDVSTQKSAVSLRSALARLDPETRSCIVAVSATLAFTQTVTVDLIEARELAHRLLGDAPLASADLSAATITTLTTEVLPDWFDDWILDENTAWRSLRLSALERVSERLLDAGRLGEAKRAAAAAVRIDPLRESPRHTLMRVHLAEGNQSEALDVFARYSDELRSALDIEPTRQLRELVDAIRR